MAQNSGFWTTGAGTGDRVVGYDQSVWSTATKIMSACARFEGVARGFLNELRTTVTGNNEVTVSPGGAVVDGKWYHNGASEVISIPSATGGGNTRIDRIVLRCNWAGYAVRLTRIAGTNAGTPTPPAITQTSGTTYDVTVAQVLVNTSGDCTVIEERQWAESAVDTYYIQALDGEVEQKNDLFSFAVINGHDRYNVVRLWARLLVASDSGAVVIRLYNVTRSQAIGSVSISQGTVIASTVSITNPALRADDIIRVDVTDEGSGAEGLQVQVQVSP